MKVFLKQSIVWLLLSLFFAPPVLGELTQADLEAIRAIVREEIAESEKRTDLKFDAVNARIDATNTKIDATNTRIDEMDKRLTAEIRAVDKRFGDMRAILIALIAIIVIPTIALNYAATRIAKTHNEIATLNRQTQVLIEQTNETNKLLREVIAQRNNT